MRVVRAGTGPLHRAPLGAGPTAEVLIDENACDGQLAAAQLVIPPGAGMNKHDHDNSAALLVPLAGELVITSSGHQEKVTPGTVVALDARERFQLANQTGEPVTLLVVYTPGAFAHTLAGWPTV